MSSGSLGTKRAVAASGSRFGSLKVTAPGVAVIELIIGSMTKRGDLAVRNSARASVDFPSSVIPHKKIRSWYLIPKEATDCEAGAVVMGDEGVELEELSSPDEEGACAVGSDGCEGGDDSVDVG